MTSEQEAEISLPKIGTKLIILNPQLVGVDGIASVGEEATVVSEWTPLTKTVEVADIALWCNPLLDIKILDAWINGKDIVLKE